MTLANFQNSLSTLAPASIDKSASSPAGIMSPGLGPAELLRNCLLDWAPSGANKKLPPGLGPGSFLKKLQWGAVFLCQIEYGPSAPPTTWDQYSHHINTISCNVCSMLYRVQWRCLYGGKSHFLRFTDTSVLKLRLKSDF